MFLIKRKNLLKMPPKRNNIQFVLFIFNLIKKKN